MKKLPSLLVLAALLSGTAHAVPLKFTPTSEARVTAPLALVPTPKQAEYPQGYLKIQDLSVLPLGNEPEITWAVRDLQNEWRTRLGIALPDSRTIKRAGIINIIIGTKAEPALAEKLASSGLKAEGKEGYALLVDETGVYVIGADAKGAYYGTQTLKQLLTLGGLRYARISDSPDISQRVAMIYLDQYSSNVNDRMIPMLAQLKYNAVLIMSDYVQWDAAKAGGYSNPSGATKAEAKRVAELARSYGLEPIPLIETLGHVGWMFNNGKNLDLRQDPDSKNPFAYDTLNPETYSRVIFPVFKEAVETFSPKTIHIGHDEVRSRDRFPARENGKAAGYPKLLSDDINALYANLKQQGVGTMIWHDSAFADSAADTVPPLMPKDIQVAYWNYFPGTDFPMLDKIKKAGFPTLGASWYEQGSAEGLSKAALAAGAGGMIQARWTGYFGNPSIWDGSAEQGVAFVRAANSFWNNSSAPIKSADAVYRDLYQPEKYTTLSGYTADLSSVVNRKILDDDSKGWLLKGPLVDLKNLGTGIKKVGNYTFDISGAVMLKGTRPAVKELPAKVTLEINQKADSIAFMHTTGWSSTFPPLNREKIGSYEILYSDGSKIIQPLEYGRHIRAWTDTVPSSMIPTPAWVGQTRDGLDLNIPVLEWTNPKPSLNIASITLISEVKQANPILLGLTLINKK